MTSVPSVSEFIDGFPNTPTKIQGQPTYETLKELRQQLKENATSVPSLLGGGQNGHLGLVLPAAICNAVAPGTPFMIPDRPTALPVIPPGATGAQTNELVRQHKEQVRQWHEVENVHDALKKQLINAVDSPCLRPLRNRHNGYNNVSLRQLLQHLFTVYGRLTQHELRTNDENFKKPWDPQLPLELLIDQIEEAVETAADGGSPYTDQQVLDTAYNLVFTTGLYFDDCKLWNRRPAIDKNWANLLIVSRSRFGRAAALDQAAAIEPVVRKEGGVVLDRVGRNVFGAKNVVEFHWPSTSIFQLRFFCMGTSTFGVPTTHEKQIVANPKNEVLGIPGHDPTSIL